MSDPDQAAPLRPLSIPDDGTSLDLRSVTRARVSLNRTGCSVATRHSLEFGLAHAQARDAVHSGLAVPSLIAALRQRGLEPIAVKSAARDRSEYLRRPDLGRRLSAPSAALLAEAVEPGNPPSARVSLILADGLSPLAIERHALPLLDALLPRLGQSAIKAQSAEDPLGDSAASWTLAPIVIAEQARVALGDEVGQALHAALTVVLIGERPGLSSPDSLGVYITWAPRPGRTDAERNCVSNIRAEGLDYAAAAARIAWYAREGRRLGLTGVELRDNKLSPEHQALKAP